LEEYETETECAQSKCKECFLQIGFILYKKEGTGKKEKRKNNNRKQTKTENAKKFCDSVFFLLFCLCDHIGEECVSVG